MLAAFAMVLNTTIDDLIKRLGHDGLQDILGDVEPPVPPPAHLRGFHPQEFAYLLLNSGYSMTTLELNPLMKHGAYVVNHSHFFGKDQFYDCLKIDDGVMFGTIKQGQKGHAVAWEANEQMVYDPRGYKYRLEQDSDFAVRQFFLIQRTKDV